MKGNFILIAIILLAVTMFCSIVVFGFSSPLNIIILVALASLAVISHKNSGSGQSRRVLVALLVVVALISALVFLMSYASGWAF